MIKKARGQHVRWLGNLNKIVRVRNFELECQISNIETALGVTYQQAFELVIDALCQHRCELRQASIFIVENHRKAGV